ncbi:hypothetical protein [Streptomyces sp. YIM 98790]|nr:hypothetical protein [Streptomyces sp. YIM 98790]
MICQLRVSVHGTKRVRWSHVRTVVIVLVVLVVLGVQDVLAVLGAGRIG